ncbi:MAG: hypothetical protein J6W95_01005 [Bacteroidales bacterium]|nr:hypothetical protein [Bacteroidales bacterium]
MKKILVFSFYLLVSLATVVSAQESRRGWEKGPLTWSDFAPMNESIGAEHSYLEYILDIEMRKDEVNGVEMRTRTAVLYVDRKMSWVDTHYRTPQELRYNQVAFNLAELHRRRLQLVIDTGGPVNMNYYTRRLTYEVDSFCHETYYGADTAAVAWWEQEVRRQMDSITPLMVEQHQKANTIEKVIPEYLMSFNIGGGAKLFAGDMHRLFVPSGGMYFDFEGGLWRHLFVFGFYLGGGRCRPDSVDNVRSIDKLYATDRLTTLDMYLNYGFAAIDAQKWCVTPFVGYGMQGFLYDDEVYSESGGPIEGCWRTGVDVKYHMGADDEYLSNSLIRFLCSAHGKMYVSFDHFKSIIGDPRGATINVQLGFSFGMRELKLRRAVKEGVSKNVK